MNIEIIASAITAVATAVIAWFTIALSHATRTQAKLTEASIKLARDEFIAANRPEIIVHAVAPHLPTKDGLQLIGASVWCFNRGKSAAIDIEVRGEITRTAAPVVGHRASEIQTRSTAMRRGAKHQFYIESQIPLSEEAIRQVGLKNDAPKLFCVGTISYGDEAGTRFETGFCQMFSAATQEWQSAKMPSHEYAY
jgi:hypothetical protein